MVTEVTTFRANDGTVFDNHQEASKHEARLDLDVLLDKMTSDARAKGHDDLTVEELIANATSLRNLLDFFDYE